MIPGRFITGRFIPGRFIPECDKQLAVGAVLTGFVSRRHMTLVGLICAFVQWMSAMIRNMLTQYTILKETAMQTASFLQATSGSQRAPKKKYSQLKERVKRAIDNYG